MYFLNYLTFMNILIFKSMSSTLLDKKSPYKNSNENLSKTKRQASEDHNLHEKVSHINAGMKIHAS